MVNNSDILLQWHVLGSALDRLTADIENGSLDQHQLRDKLTHIKAQMRLVEGLLSSAGVLSDNYELDE